MKRRLAESTITPSSKSIPMLDVPQPKQIAGFGRMKQVEPEQSRRQTTRRPSQTQRPIPNGAGGCLSPPCIGVDLWITFYAIAIAHNREMTYNSGEWHPARTTRWTSLPRLVSPPTAASVAALTPSFRLFPCHHLRYRRSRPYRPGLPVQPDHLHLLPPRRRRAETDLHPRADAAIAADGVTRRPSSPRMSPPRGPKRWRPSQNSNRRPSPSAAAAVAEDGGTGRPSSPSRSPPRRPRS